MPVCCPHCRSPIDAFPSGPGEVVCSSCGSGFRLERAATTVGLPPRRWIGRFEVLEQVGVGAFGTVYKGRDPELDRTVAIKVPRAGNFDDAQQRERFLREARSAAQLRHPSIVPVHEVGEDQGAPYLVSEFIQGVSLADWLTARRPAPREAARLIAILADALQYAHEHGVVHRDVKPANVMLEGGAADLLPRLMDFGAAKRDAGEITVTMDGQILGTPAYMSPEQAGGSSHHVDGRSDVYSLGVLLYELLTGELPFRGNMRMLLHQVLHDEPRPPRSLNDRLPRDLETICTKAMAKEARRRYQSAADLAADLRRFLAAEPIQARPVGTSERLWRWCRRNPALALTGGVAGTAVIAMIAVLLVLLENAVELAESNVAKAKAEQSARDEADLRRRRAEADAASLMFEQAHAKCLAASPQALLWLARALDMASAAQDAELEQSVRLHLSAWSPGGRVPRFQGPYRAAAFSPDSKFLFTARDQTARVWDLAIGEPVGPALRHHASILDFRFSSHGRVLATTGLHTAQLWEAGTGRRLGQPFPGEPIFSPDGRHVLTRSDDYAAQLREAVTGNVVAEPLRHWRTGQRAIFSPDSKLLLTLGTDQKLGVWDVELARPKEPAPSGSNGTFSPDGKFLVTHGHGPVQLWETATWRLVSEFGQDPKDMTGVLFGPDSKSFVTLRHGDNRLWNVHTAKQIVELAQTKAATPKFSPDGRLLLALVADGWRRWDTRTGKPLEPPFPSGPPPIYGGFAAFSPDGKWVITSTEGSRSIVLRNAETGKPVGHPLEHDLEVKSLRFSPDSKFLLTVSGGWTGPKTARLWEVRTARLLGPPLRLGGNFDHILFSPDGSYLMAGTAIGEKYLTRLWLAPLAMAGAPEHIRLWTEVIAGMDLDEHGLARIVDFPTWRAGLQRLEALGWPGGDRAGLHAPTAAADGAARLENQANLTQLGMALHTYHERNFRFPPAVVYSKDGQPLYSWRVLILPFLGPEGAALYQRFNLGEAWDSPSNKKLLSSMPRVFRCPVVDRAREPFATSYQVFDGLPDAKGRAPVFQSDPKAGLVPLRPQPGLDVEVYGSKGGPKLSFIRDGTSFTLLIGSANAGVPWSKPGDLVYDASAPVPEFDATALFCDGTVRYLGGLDEKTIRILITANDGQIPPEMPGIDAIPFPATARRDDAARKLLGVWEHAKGDAEPRMLTLEFARDGKITMRSRFNGKDTVKDGTARIDDRSLTIDTPDEKQTSATYAIMKLTEHVLILEDERSDIQEYRRK